jgi:hypothetical protein
VHIFSIKELGAKHWKLVASSCELGDEYPSPKREREIEEEVMIHFPCADVHYLVTAESAAVTKMK